MLYLGSPDKWFNSPEFLFFGAIVSSDDPSYTFMRNDGEGGLNLMRGPDFETRKTADILSACGISMEMV